MLTRRDQQHLANVLNQVWVDHSGQPTNLEVTFVGEDEIRALHRDYLQDDSATDVITFDLGAAPEGLRVAMIAVCVPVARQYARQYHVKLHDELRRLVIHGALHLLGYDDHTAKAKRQMRYWENKILHMLSKGSLRAQPTAVGLQP
ncbi:MAG: rRNA maturation RNase YbeY [candidate division KSB1 bacterium]|nr:rRNA maturation RNase YbeY [candidate division KSB1 bacterium]MDZ7302914.1 rRNA maturation RNase YbeY [candidate division KSB1 bacterium]MDZ7310489.1 rRNA maturation RNase YbeY [candidate division KSB1 bacterium]